MGASGFHGRVRNGVGWGTRAIGHQVDGPPPLPAPRRSGGGGWLGKSWHGPSVPGRGMRLSLAGVEVDRAIRTGQLHASPRVHTRPIDVVVYHGPDGETWFCGRFPA